MTSQIDLCSRCRTPKSPRRIAYHLHMSRSAIERSCAAIGCRVWPTSTSPQAFPFADHQPAAAYTPGELVQVDIRNSAASPTVADNAGLGGSSATVTTRGRAAVTPSCTRRSTTVPARLFRGALRRTQGGSRPDLGRGSQLLRRTRYRGADRQRFLLSLTLLRGGARSERQAPLHPPISSADQWKGRAIEPDVGRRRGHTPRCICPTRPARRNTVRLPLGVDTPDTGSSGEPVGMSTWDVSRCIRRISGKTLSRCTARPMANARTQFPVRR